MSKQPPPAPTASAVGPRPTEIQIVGRPDTGSLPSNIASPDHTGFDQLPPTSCINVPSFITLALILSEKRSLTRKLDINWLVVLGLAALSDSISVYIGPSSREREKEGK